MKLSIIIPVYNQEELVRKAIESIPRRNDIEIIAIDDRSTDNSYNVIKEYEYVRTFKNDKNIGVGATRNKGIELATGEYVMFLDSDDYLYPMINEFMKLLHDKDIIYYGLIENDGTRIMPTPQNNSIVCGTVKAIKKSFIGDSRYAEANFAEDWYFNKSLLDKKPTMEFSNIYLLHYNHPREGSLFDIATNKRR